MLESQRGHLQSPPFQHESLQCALWSHLQEAHGQQVRAWKAKEARPHPRSRPAHVASIPHSGHASGTVGCPWHEWAHSAQHTGGQAALSVGRQPSSTSPGHIPLAPEHGCRPSGGCVSPSVRVNVTTASCGTAHQASLGALRVGLGRSPRRSAAPLPSRVSCYPSQCQCLV